MNGVKIGYVYHRQIGRLPCTSSSLSRQVRGDWCIKTTMRGDLALLLPRIVASCSETCIIGYHWNTENVFATTFANYYTRGPSYTSNFSDVIVN